MINSDCCLRSSAPASLRTSVSFSNNAGSVPSRVVTKRRVHPHQSLTAGQVFKRESKRRMELVVIGVHQF